MELDEAKKLLENTFVDFTNTTAKDALDDIIHTFGYDVIISYIFKDATIDFSSFECGVITVE
jgi:hypothetical protein